MATVAFSFFSPLKKIPVTSCTSSSLFIYLFILYIYIFRGPHKSPKKKKRISFWLIRPILYITSRLAVAENQRVLLFVRIASFLVLELLLSSSSPSLSLSLSLSHSLSRSIFEFLCFIPATKATMKEHCGSSNCNCGATCSCTPGNCK